MTNHDSEQRQPDGMLRQPPWNPRAGADHGVVAVAQQADRAADAELQLRRQQQQRAGWLEANAAIGPAYQQVIRRLAWQARASGLAHEAVEQDRS